MALHIHTGSDELDWEPCMWEYRVWTHEWQMVNSLTGLLRLLGIAQHTVMASWDGMGSRRRPWRRQKQSICGRLW